MDEDDLANRLIDDLKEEGYKSFEEKLRAESYERASREYERRLMNPYDY